MSISFSLTGVNAFGQYPNQSVFKQISLDMNAVCVVKRDQPVVPADAPVCLYEAEMSFCRNYIAFPIDIEFKRVNVDEVVDVESILKKNGLAGGRRMQSSLRGKSEADIAATEVEVEMATNDRQLQKREGTLFGDQMIEAVEVTKEVYSLDPPLIELLCPQLGCLIPLKFCLDKREGGFTAHGTGSSDIKITGGTAGLFGAFGQVRAVYYIFVHLLTSIWNIRISCSLKQLLLSRCRLSPIERY